MAEAHKIPSRSNRLIGIISDRISGYSSLKAITLCLSLIAAITLLDLLANPDMPLSLLYLAPIAFATWRFGRPAGLLASALCALISLVVDLQTGFPMPIVPYWNAFMRFGFFSILTYTLSILSVALEWDRTDYLTGLNNERGFDELAERELHRSFRTGRMMTLAYLDLDNFRFVNERFGRSSGDRVLELAGKTLSAVTRKGDVVSRTDGDAFLILFPETDFFGAAIAIQNVRNALVRSLAEKNWVLTFSIGVATFQSPPESIAAAITQAKDLLHTGKSGGGKNTTVHRQIVSEKAGQKDRRGLRGIRGFKSR